MRLKTSRCSRIAGAVEKKLDALDVIHRSALTSITSIRESKDLTTKGKQLEGKMAPKQKRPDGVVAELRQRELRDYL